MAPSASERAAVTTAADGTAAVVIGANYGDEGKGLVTDHLAARRSPALVVRANSSAQAGHTVVTPDGRRHVFHHVGAGALAGAATLLGPSFVAHPMLLGSELADLAGLGVEPVLHVDPRSPVATPYDVVVNQLVERARGRDRHGSCGIGFGEAVERSLRPRFALTVGDLGDADRVGRTLRRIRDEWVPRRLATLGVTAAPDDRRLLGDPALVESWLLDVADFVERTRPVEPGRLPPGAPIFENAQGLLLDEEGDDFPHLTRSRTGLTNVVRLAQETGLTRLDVTYVTRAYLTRHGAGPLPNELPAAPAGVTDPTNLPNPFQGRLRVAWLDLDTLAERIDHDLRFRAAGITATARLAVTCLDQLEVVTWRVGGRERRGDEGRLLEDLSRVTGLPVGLVSHGPSRRDVTEPTIPTRSLACASP